MHVIRQMLADLTVSAFLNPSTLALTPRLHLPQPYAPPNASACNCLAVRRQFHGVPLAYAAHFHSRRLSARRSLGPIVAVSRPSNM
jgi:hypothetical protein